MHFVFDFIIFSFLIVDGAVLYMVLLRCLRGSSSVEGWILAAVLSLSWIVIFYGSFIEPRRLIVHKQEIPLTSGATHALRVALISDIHVGPYKQADWVEKVVAKTNALTPDLVVIAGDSISYDKDEARFLTPLKDLRARYGVIAVLGNHDYGDHKEVLQEEGAEARAEAVRETLEGLGITVLINRGIKLETSGGSLFLLGTDDWWTHRADIDAALDTLPGISRKTASSSRSPVVLISHNPDIIHEAAEAGIDLVLAGHTHAGQIRLPLIGSVPKIPDKLGRAYDRGLFQFGKTQLFITSGAGESGPRARLLVPPEIALVTIMY